MVVAQSSMEMLDRVAPVTSTYPYLSRTQQAVLECVTEVRDLHDEEDVQCLLFLAEEFALLQSSPFYFSVQSAGEMRHPCSMVLRDTLCTLLDRGLIGWENGNFHAHTGIVPRAGAGRFPSALSWLAALSSVERRALAQATLTLRGQGISARARSAEQIFRQTLGQLLGTDAAEALVRRLYATR